MSVAAPATLTGVEVTRTTSGLRDCGMSSDQVLIAACRAGDQDAWRTVYEQYHRLVAAIARSYGATEHDADEIVQISFSILHDSIHRIADDSRLAAWLSTIARRHTWRLLESRRRSTPTEIADGDIAHDPVREHADRNADEEVLRAALRLMPARCRVLLEAMYLRPDEPAYTEIAAELGMPIGSIGPTRSRCLGRLREIVETMTSTPEGSRT